MAQDPIVQEGDPVLRAKSKIVPKKDIGSPALAKILKKMHAALAPERYGVAIAAPQVGESLRMFMVAGRVFKEDTEDGEEAAPTPPNRVYINPEITRASRRKLEESEGCLSVRSIYGIVLRHQKVTLKYTDEHGRAQSE